jgi:hypothetical protein
MNPNRVQRWTGWFLLWTSAMLAILATVPENGLSALAILLSVVFGLVAVAHLRGPWER